MHARKNAAAFAIIDARDVSGAVRDGIGGRDGLVKDTIARALPSGALADALHHAFARGGPVVPAHDWVVLTFWAAAGPVAAALTFRWE